MSELRLFPAPVLGGYAANIGDRILAVALALQYDELVKIHGEKKYPRTTAAMGKFITKRCSNESLSKKVNVTGIQTDATGKKAATLVEQVSSKH